MPDLDSYPVTLACLLILLVVQLGFLTLLWYAARELGKVERKAREVRLDPWTIAPSVDSTQPQAAPERSWEPTQGPSANAPTSSIRRTGS